MDILGVTIPLWAVFIIGIIGVIVLWKFIKFAIKLLLVVILFFMILILLDYFEVFNIIQNFFSGII